MAINRVFKPHILGQIAGANLGHFSNFMGQVWGTFACLLGQSICPKNLIAPESAPSSNPQKSAPDTLLGHFGALFYRNRIIIKKKRKIYIPICEGIGRSVFLPQIGGAS